MSIRKEEVRKEESYFPFDNRVRKMTTKIPRTNGVGRFAKMLGKETDQAVLERVRKDAETYGHCRMAWLKPFFEAALERTVEVELKQSCIPGTPSCGFVPHI